jgi:hypothetical protein
MPDILHEGQATTLLNFVRDSIGKSYYTDNEVLTQLFFSLAEILHFINQNNLKKQ